MGENFFFRVESIKVLGVKISHRFSVAEHVDNLLAACCKVWTTGEIALKEIAR
jgi:hypothetical protein